MICIWSHQGLWICLTSLMQWTLLNFLGLTVTAGTLTVQERLLKVAECYMPANIQSPIMSFWYQKTVHLP